MYNRRTPPNKVKWEVIYKSDNVISTKYVFAGSREKAIRKAKVSNIIDLRKVK